MEIEMTADGFLYINGELITKEAFEEKCKKAGIGLSDDPVVFSDGISVTRESTIRSIVSPDAPTTTNEHGGSQSDVNVRFDLIDAKAMFEMAKVLDHGAKKYGANNWRLIPVDDHLNHLLMHTYAYLAGDRTDDHLSHILCRATFALGVKLDER